MSARGRHIAAVFLRRLLVASAHGRFGFASRARRRQAFARQARIACEELGPTFIKLGQLASVRPDVFSPELVFELEKLQDSVAPVSTDLIRDVIARELGYDVDALFDSFDPRPLASASIAQVYRARLRKGCRPVMGAPLEVGAEVVVKVVRPGIARVIREDLAAARALLDRVKGIGLLRRLDVHGLLDEFAASLRSELDLRNEGRVADRFRFDFRDDPLVFAPRIVWSRTTRSVLTMEYVEGWRLSEITDAERAGVDGYALAVHGAGVFMRQVLVLGRFHADLHPANLFVTPDSRICYLDFGIVGRTEPSQRVPIAQVLAATVYGDADRAIRYSAELGLVIPAHDESRVRAQVASLMEETLRSGTRADVRAFAIGFLSIMAEHHVKIPVGYGLLIKALVTVEGVAQALYPDIDIAQAARPFATRLIAHEMMRPARLWGRAPDVLKAALRVLAE